MLDTPKEKKKRRGNPDRYREYMAAYMREWRARRKVKPKKEEKLP